MFNGNLKQARILAIDDDPDYLALLQTAFRIAGYQTIRIESDSLVAAELLNTWQPDLIVLDLDMPKKTGTEILREFIASHPDSEARPPVVVVTGIDSSAVRLQALQAGAIDVVKKPFDAEELLCRCGTYLRLRQLTLTRTAKSQRLEHLVRERTTALVRAQTEILQRLASACELRDDDTGKHTERVGIMAGRIAEQLAMRSEVCQMLRLAAPLHDVGKVGIPDSILLKPGKLDVAEFEIMKTHTTLGAKILSDADSELVNMAAIIAETHHERWDGRGYPKGLGKEDIPMTGRIVAIADVFDALTHDRPYKRAMPESEAIELILANAGSQFDPQIVHAFSRVHECSIR